MIAAALLPGLLAAAGVAYTLVAAALVRAFAARPRPTPVPPEPVTLLKPLHGPEPRLAENLATFLDQDWDAPIEMVCGLQRADDPARAVVHALAARHDPHAGRASGSTPPPGPARADGWMPDPIRHDGGDMTIVEIVDPARHGANAKVSNLVNMATAASHDLIVLSDSDMAAPRDYLATLAATLAQPNVGAVTCAYVGRGDAGGWSQAAAASISYGFLPMLLLGLRLGLAKPGMGSTIALRRPTLDAIGGFRPLADVLADDYELCAAVRRQGSSVAVPPLLPVHACTEASLAELWRHERRWAITVRKVDPAGFAGTIVTHPVPFALLAFPFAPLAGATLLAAALAARLILKREVDRAAGFAALPASALPLRDCLSLAVFLSAFVARSVDWRGATLRMRPKGRIAARPESDPR